MLADFERRLAEVLGSRLPAPFAGRVTVAPAAAAGAGPLMQLAVGEVVPLDPDVGSVRPELAPGSLALRRVVRLRCQVAVEVVAGDGAGRAQRVAGVDALLHLVDGPDLRSGSALVEGGDPGFLLESLRLAGADVSLALGAGAGALPALPALPAPPAVRLVAEGWFWPVGVAGETGEPIVEAQVRQVVLPIVLRPALTRLVAGSAPVAFDLALGAGATLRVPGRGDPPPPPSPFGSVAVGLVGRAGGPGAGTLAGGADGPGGHRLVAVTGGHASATYTPPAAPTTDQLVVSAFVVDAGGEARVGLELARFPLRVEAGG